MNEKANLDTIFCAAIEIESFEQREAYLDEACGEDDELRRQLTRLLEAHFRGGSIIDSPPVDPGETALRPMSETTGNTIGPYKLLQQLGEGGMGEVYLAEQTEPVERRVAVKIIKAGMDTRQVIARFEAERQALAMMDHPNIASVWAPTRLSGLAPSRRLVQPKRDLSGLPASLSGDTQAVRLFGHLAKSSQGSS